MDQNRDDRTPPTSQGQGSGLLLLFAMIRSVVKSFKIPDVDVVEALIGNESALTHMTDSTPKKRGHT